MCSKKPTLAHKHEPINEHLQWLYRMVLIHRANCINVKKVGDNIKIEANPFGWTTLKPRTWP